MPKHPKPWTENHRVQNHVRKIMHKTIGRSAQPNIGSKNQNFSGRCPGPHRRGLPAPLKPPVNPLLHNRHNEGGFHSPSNPLVNYVG